MTKTQGRREGPPGGRAHSRRQQDLRALGRPEVAPHLHGGGREEGQGGRRNVPVRDTSQENWGWVKLGPALDGQGSYLQKF